jgi:hypothetical protein
VEAVDVRNVSTSFGLRAAISAVQRADQRVLAPVGARSKQLKSATCGECRSESWESHSNWNGGRLREKKGYVIVRVPDDPRAGKNRYVRTRPRQRRSAWQISGQGRNCAPSKWCARRQSTKISNFGFDFSRQVSGRVMPSPGLTRSSDVTRVVVHLQRPSRPRVRTLGGGGARTPVLRSRSRPSPSAAGIRLSGMTLLPAGSATP